MSAEEADPPAPPTGDADPLAPLRAEIEAVDDQIVSLVRRRLEVARSIGAIKRSRGAPSLVPEREAAVVRRAAELAREMNVPAEEVRDLFWILIRLCRRLQQEAAGDPRAGI